MREQVAVKIDRDLNTNASASGNHLLVQLFFRVDEFVNVKRIGVAEAVEKCAALRTSWHRRRAFEDSTLVIDGGLYLANVGVNGRAQNDHLADGHDQREHDGHGVAPHVQHFLIEDGHEATKWSE